jgi:predicted solute-binding protein
MTQNSKDHLTELKEMVQKRKSTEPVEKVLAVFCQRHGLSMDTCRGYYNQLIKSGEIKEK